MKRQKRAGKYRSFRKLERDAKRKGVSPLDLMLGTTKKKAAGALQNK